MRDLTFVAGLVSLAACGDSSRPTAPRASSEASSSLVQASDVHAAAGKPTDQIGFTRVTEVTSSIVLVQPGAAEEVKVACPAGTTLVGGGYHFTGFNNQTTPPWIWWNQRYYASPDSWTVRASNTQPGAVVFGLVVSAYCLS